ncbi:MAG: alcohol dehydrogenase catalytic domain-containing protein, partial [Verrucomicrobia bacterium]|nr:alcohol dehydrogenase catalytic domain-containing protein [Verrucomicrobiota bacterium]
MMMAMFHGYAAMERGQALKTFDYAPDELAPMDVEVAITHCGICHSDLHLIDNDWKISRYPFVPGHEIIGSVTATGALVTHLKSGDRVGIGWQRGACLACEPCLAGDDNLCAKH